MDYLLLYLKADVFENLRKVCKSIRNLDPFHYYTTPGLSWNTMLKLTNINLELLTDLNTHTLIAKGIRRVLRNAVINIQ